MRSNMVSCIRRAAVNSVGNALRGVPGPGVGMQLPLRGTPRRAFPTGVLLFVFLQLRAFSALAGPEIPGAPQSKPIALVGGVIHPLSGPEIRGGVLLFDKGRITAVGKD